MASVLNVVSKANCALLAMTGGLHGWRAARLAVRVLWTGIFSTVNGWQRESFLYAEQQRINNVK